ncbi:2,3-diaminopropionate biosynthesis protein SbnA [Burkholderia sp. WAC0059]|uniref:2,3-diaminopropionate biosynthesis protein SbnA n=1 Tax=Burkholderia sp. WAC0059 TaxID=2066022 RepID=UPI000C7F0B85|nr:2,3-diaminopropionate biosynthesis protein SbnA [Burkholderia sp. WAC0059]PLZ02450.1 2,3-diaminopropionate biosynthesis protein SbnA [Burkholderia sp. WAC0059]
MNFNSSNWNLEVYVAAISNILNDHNFVKIEHFGFDALFMKLEAFNAAGSIKMKTALGMIEDLEARGRIGQRTMLIESSSGSLGVALSIICAERGYRFTCVVDPNASPSNVKVMKALGTEVVTVDQRDANGGFLGTRIAYIHDAVSQDCNYLWLNQYANPQNPRAHYRATARAIAESFEAIDYLFVGAGTTGTLMGCVQYFAQYRPDTRIIAVDAVGSVTFGGSPGPRHIPGLGTSRRPEIFSPEGIHAFEMVPEVDTIAMCRFLARSNGILAGGSTGTVLAGVKAWQERIPADAVIVLISPDLGERYLDTVYDDDWVIGRFGAIPQWPLPLDLGAASQVAA